MARLLTIILLCCMAAFSVAQKPADTSFVTISGTVKDKDSKKSIGNVCISLDTSNIATVSNDDGTFSLTIPATSANGKIKSEQLGYFSNTMFLSDILAYEKDITILMTSSAKMLKEVVVRGGKADEIVAEAINKIPLNYSPNKNLFTAFYRETVQKGKLKNSDFLFGYGDLGYYNFKMERLVSIDDRMQYVIRFTPKVKLDYALCHGLLYIDQETLSFSKAEFELDMSDRSKATNAILRKKPRGLHFKPQEVAFTVTYRLEDGVSYLSYIKAKTRFKCDWKRRLFSSGYTTYTEMVMVDRVDNPEEGISRKLAFGNNDIFYNAVTDYWDIDYWKGYNIIEPTESLDKAVVKLKKNNTTAMSLYK